MDKAISSSDKVSAKETISLSVNDSKYMLASASVTGADGSAVDVSTSPDGVYSFTMPGSDVTIDANVVEKPGLTAEDTETIPALTSTPTPTYTYTVTTTVDGTAERRQRAIRRGGNRGGGRRIYLYDHGGEFDRHCRRQERRVEQQQPFRRRCVPDCSGDSDGLQARKRNAGQQRPGAFSGVLRRYGEGLRLPVRS